MGYYDKVKDSIREENDDEVSKDKDANESSVSGNFDTLKEAAEETDVEDEEDGDDTPIEILDEDGLSKQEPSSREKKGESQRKTEGNPDKEKKSSETRNEPSKDGIVSGDTSDLEDKLDKIIEQNARMIEILESFGN